MSAKVGSYATAEKKPTIHPEPGWLKEQEVQDE